ncbi:MAG: long-chain-fatty-acid--CoA ligase [Vicinamibacterales bacterium]
MGHLNLASVLTHSGRLTPERAAITCGSRTLTYAELDSQSTRAAGALAGLGVRPGDRVVLSCPNVPWFPVAYFAILKAGASVVPLNVLLKPREIALHLRDCGARVMLAFDGTSELPMREMARTACDDVGGIALVRLPAGASGETPDAPATLPALMQSATPFELPATSPDDTAVILYTSGTTGRPKGAELSHANMVGNAVVCHDMFKPAFDGGTGQDATLITLPLFHSTAQTAQMNAGLYGGFRLVLLPRFDPVAVLDAFSREQIGLWVGVPTMYWALLQHARTSGFDLAGAARSLRLCASGGAPMPVEVLHAFERTFGVPVLEGYGLSETAPVVAFNQLQRPSKPGTVGLPVFGVEVRTVDDQDRPVPAGERGEIVVRGPNVMKGYFGDPAATAEAMRGGWFHTGDIGEFDAEGYLAVVDRKKDMILRGGFNVYPREIEDVLMAHPAVGLCAVVGIPDARLGEEVKAFVVRRGGADISAEALTAWCREQMAAYKYPRVIEFREALPLGATGKVLKRELRD